MYKILITHLSKCNVKLKINIINKVDGRFMCHFETYCGEKSI